MEWYKTNIQSVENIETVIGKMSKEQLIRFFRQSLKLFNIKKISEVNFKEFQSFGLLKMCKDFEGSFFVTTTDLGMKLYNYLSYKNNRGEIYMQEGKWYIM